MRSLKLEQVAVIKFLTLEEVDFDDIYKRLKNVFKKYVLCKEKVYKLHTRFSTEGLLGNLDNPIYMEECIDLKEDSQFNNEFNQSIKEELILNQDDETLSNIFSDYEEDSNDNEDSMEESNFAIKSERLKTIDKRKTFQQKYNFTNNSITFKPTFYNLTKKTAAPPKLKSKKASNEFNKNLVENIELPFLPAVSSYHCEELLSILHHSANLFCLLCENKSFRVFSRLKRHLGNAHIRHSVVLATVRSLHCKKFCHNPFKQTRPGTTKGHYHCPLCSWYFFCRNRLARHYSTHLTQSEKYCYQGEFEKQKFRCIGVDHTEGIFLVCKSRFGNTEPVHVMKKLSADGETVIKSSCSEELCEEAMQLAKKNGNFSLECKHLASINLKANFNLPSHYFTLTEDSFKVLNIQLTAEEFQSCMALSEVATQIHTPLLIEWVETDTIIFFSVFCDEPFATMGRTLVKLDIELEAFTCSCNVSINHFCPYKVISEIYFMTA